MPSQRSVNQRRKRECLPSAERLNRGKLFYRSLGDDGILQPHALSDHDCVNAMQFQYGHLMSVSSARGSATVTNRRVGAKNYALYGATYLAPSIPISPGLDYAPAIQGRI